MRAKGPGDGAPTLVVGLLRLIPDSCALSAPHRIASPVHAVDIGSVVAARFSLLPPLGLPHVLGAIGLSVSGVHTLAIAPGAHMQGSVTTAWKKRIA